MGAFIDNELPEDKKYLPHAGSYEACERTELVALCDTRQELLDHAGERYSVPAERRYTDYQRMLAEQKPDILSVATQPEPRAKIVIYAAEHGVRAMYAEKAMAASLAEADAMVAAVKANGVHFNLGTNRRWDRGYDTMAAAIAEQRYGKLRSLIAHQTGALFNTASHTFDLLLRLNGDAAVSWVHGQLSGEVDIRDDVLINDPVGHGMIGFANDVVGYALNSGRGWEVEAVCEGGVLTTLANGDQWQLREARGADYRGRTVLQPGEFPAFERNIPTVDLVLDLVAALDGGGPLRGGPDVARAGLDIIFGFLESHQRGGARVELPLGESRYRMQRQVEGRTPRYQRDS